MTTLEKFKPYPVKLHIDKAFTCGRCGRPAKRKRTFCRRVKAEDTRLAMLAEIDRQAAAWEPTMHRRCELLGAR